MARKARPVFDADRLVDEFKVYDRHVDVVSSFHWLYTQVTELADTVAQFERYPSIKVGDKSLTPDFTVAFTDGSGMAGEVANLSLRDESVEGLCRQLQGYAELTEMPGPPNQKGHQAPLPVSPVDVLFLGWRESRGATVEHAVAVACGIPVLEEKEGNPNEQHHH